MRIFSIEGEPTRFRVESTSLECPECLKLFPRLQPKNKDLRIGDPCPACGQGKLDSRFHLVDLASCWPVGQCACESWKYNLLKKIKLIPAESLGSLTKTQVEAISCSHLEAAWFAYGRAALARHEAHRMAGAGRQTEEAQP